jgi:hypothetical protein
MKIILKSQFLLLLFFVCVLPAFGQKIMKGRVQELESKAPMFGVFIENMNTKRSVMTDSFGNFEIEVDASHLIEISKFTYKTIKIRIPKGNIPKFYILDMDFDVEELEEISFVADLPKHVVDSLKRTETYRAYVNFMRKETLNPISDVFTLMSKRNKQIWAFQKAFEYWEGEKFIEYMFNDDIILRITELNANALAQFKETYRPTYDFIKRFDTDYDYYVWLKKASEDFLYKIRQNYRRD